MYEHHVYDKGDLKGLYAIDVEEARKLSYWEGVIAIIDAYVKLHPQEVREIVLENKVVRHNNYNKFGTGKSKTIRHSLNLPPGLYHYLNEYDPELFNNKKKLNELMRNAGGFCTCDAV